MRTGLVKYVSRHIRGYLRRKILSKYGLGVVAETKNGVMVVDPHDFVVSRELLRTGEYDWPDICWLLDILDKDSQVLVVGTHIGSVLVPLARNVRQVIGFEADPINFRLLQCNVKVNELRNVQVFNKAVGDERQTVHVSHNWINSGDSSVCTASHNGGSAAVEMVTLDESVTPDRLDLVVMDIQGCECRAIRGGSRVISSAKYFYIEYAPDWLESQGASSEELVSQLDGMFEHMYMFRDSVTAYESRSWIDFLTHLPRKRLRVLDLLFTNELLPEKALQHRRQGPSPKKDMANV